MRRSITLLFLLSCAHTTDELTVEQHRNEAEIHEAKAKELREKAGAGPQRPQPQEWNARVYSPAEQQLDSADREMRAAADHLSAARTLEAFEDARCADIPKAERAACPLLASSVLRVSETPQGILLELKPSVDAVATERRLDCHLAYATARGFDRPSCPLFVKGMSISLVLGNGARWIAMTADDEAVAAQIREQARRVFRVPVNVSTRY